MVYRLASMTMEYPQLLKVVGCYKSKAIYVTILGEHDPRDHGRLVGGKGRNIKALKAILTAYGKQHDTEVHVRLDDPKSPARSKGTGYKANPDWDATKKDEIGQTIQEVAEMASGLQVNVSAYNTPRREDTITVFTLVSNYSLDRELLEALRTLFLAAGMNTGRRIDIHAESAA